MQEEFLLKIQSVIRWEYLLELLALSGASWLFYKVALTDLSKERHRIFHRQFRELGTRIALAIVVFGLHTALLSYRELTTSATSILSCSGLLTIFLGAALAIKIFKVFVFEYFFFGSKKEGVPLLLVNVCSLILSMLILGWALTGLFGVQLSSVLATSAVLTIVLGLALQDTLGNLFAAISLQIDKPFELDDWIEIKTGSEKIAGQVKELSWRATTLLALTDEYTTIPNRSLAQCQIVNFSGKHRPFYRGHTFRIPFDAPLEQAKATLLEATSLVPDILAFPEPICIVLEAGDSWVLVKLAYAIRDYGAQYIIADKLHTKAFELLAARGIRLAAPRILLEKAD